MKKRNCYCRTIKIYIYHIIKYFITIITKTSSIETLARIINLKKIYEIFNKKISKNKIKHSKKPWKMSS